MAKSHFLSGQAQVLKQPLLASPPFIRKSFPNLAQLKARANNLKDKPGDSWPTLILNAEIKESYRPDIRGPFSVFMNRKGKSTCTIEGYRVAIPEDTYLICNTGQYYSLEIESPTPVETFNLHIGNAFLTEIQASLSLPAEQLLLDPQVKAGNLLNFPNRLNPKTLFMEKWIERAHQSESTEELDTALIDLFIYLYKSQNELLREINRLPALRKATRTELHLRLNLVRDCLYSQPLQPYSLEDLAQIACLSKYHFLRMFRAAYGCTPHQFQLRLRVEKARQLLKNTRLTIQEIADLLNFDEPASLSRLFHRQMGVYPSQYRNLL
jgi:AraC family transcriptional regulator